MAMTTEQRRAQHAWEKASRGVREYDKEYGNEPKGRPALIMNSGLMQVMAILNGKGGRQSRLGEDLRDWLHRQCGTPKDFEGFMNHLVELDDARRFQAISAEAFAWLKWLRQMAPACLKEN
jgi:CRISPR-associated protein Cmr5